MAMLTAEQVVYYNELYSNFIKIVAKTHLDCRVTFGAFTQ